MPMLRAGISSGMLRPMVAVEVVSKVVEVIVVDGDSKTSKMS